MHLFALANPSSMHAPREIFDIEITDFLFGIAIMYLRNIIVR